MLKGPTGCGKTRFVEHMAWRLRRPLVTVACHDDLSASDLIGRYLVRASETVWQDGPLTRAVRAGALCYLDEVVEARQDTVVVIHPLTDDRRVLPIDKTGELLEAPPGFQLIVSYNPGYQHILKDLKIEHAPALRRARVRLPAARARDAHRRATRAAWITPPPPSSSCWRAGSGSSATADSPRCRARASSSRRRGSSPAAYRRGDACRTAVAAPLTDDPDLLAAIHDVIAAVL